MLFFALGACSMSRYGKLESQIEVKQSFEAYQILPNHKYYFRGPRSKPTVIVGINDDYELNLKMWVPIETDSTEFRRLIQIVSLQGIGNQVEPWGFRILDSQGHEIGVWYSTIRNVAVEINENRQIINLQPGAMVSSGEQLR
jgi:hypothetical protein